MRPTTLLTALMGGLAVASPLANTVLARRGGKIVTAQAAIEAIMPTSKKCDNTDECRTAKQAAPFLIDAMKGFSLGQIAAMLALIGLESVDMKFKHNVFPGRPGQGTSNMMMADFVAEYAVSIFGESAIDGKSPDDVLAMVTPDEHNFGSAPWFLRTKCTKEVQTQLLGGTDEGWAAYMGCIGVPADDPDRVAYWTRAKEVFGL